MIDYFLLSAFAAMFLLTKSRNSLVALILFASWFPLMAAFESWFWVQVISAGLCALSARLCAGNASLILFLFAAFCYVCALDAIAFPYVETFVYSYYEYISFALNSCLLASLSEGKHFDFCKTHSFFSVSRRRGANLPRVETRKSS